MFSAGSGTAKPGRKRVVLVAPPERDFGILADVARQDGFRVESLQPEAVGAEVAAFGAAADAVAVIDVSTDPTRGMAAVSAFRRLAKHIPVVVVAENPSLELVRRVRLSGVFYLALDPVSAEELRTVLYDAMESLARGRADASTCQARPKILIIDDDVDFCTSSSALLESQGYIVVRALNGKDGLAKVTAEHPDLIILDIMMENDWAGYEVNQAIKHGGGYESARHTPIVMVSSVPVDPATRFCMAGEVGMVTADAYLTKPLDIPRFLELLRTFLGQAGDGTPAPER
jgi:twitching motility two-component system response regulator PilG